MASKGRLPPPHGRRPLPGPDVLHPDPYASAIRPPLGGFPPFEMLPPHEVIEQKLSAQHIEIEKLATENRRLAATNGTLRHDLATAKHELQLIHAHIADMKSEKEQQIRGITDKTSMMESELGAKETIKKELQQARDGAQSLVATRQELISKAQQLTRDLQMAHAEAQKIPSLMAELNRLREEYQHCRATYDYEKKLYSDHLESLQVMEKNYMAMSREVEKLRAELTNSANFDHQTGGPYSGYSSPAGYNESVSMGNGQNAYGVGQGQSPLVGGGSAGGPVGAAGTGVNSPHVIAQSAPAGPATAHDASRGPGYGALRGMGYDPQRGHLAAGYDPQKGHPGAGYDPQRGPTGPSYDSQRGPTGPGYDAQRGPSAAYNTPRGPGYEVQRTPGYDPHRGSAYDGLRAPAYDMQRGSGDDASSRGTGQPVSVNNIPYASMPNNRSGTGYDPKPRGRHPVRR